MKRIDSLTSIRFFAAAAIVFMHSRNEFKLTSDLVQSWPLHYGVTFFFVLSGFILTYVYHGNPLKSKREFYIARFSRIWPAHIASLLLLMAVLPSSQWIWEGANSILVPIANIFLLQSIVPIPAYYFSFNGVSWSISTELMFYVIFPFILLDWKKTYVWKIGTCVFLVLSMLLSCDLFNLPPFSQENFLMLTSHGMIFISPLTRILEFMLGIIAAKISIQFGLLIETRPQSIIRWSLIEIATFLVTLYMSLICKKQRGSSPLYYLPLQIIIANHDSLEITTYGTPASD